MCARAMHMVQVRRSICQQEKKLVGNNPRGTDDLCVCGLDPMQWERQRGWWGGGGVGRGEAFEGCVAVLDNSCGWFVLFRFCMSF